MPKPVDGTPGCPVERYARGVVAGRILAGRLVRLACERHLRDLQEGPKRGLRWDAKAAERIFKFFEFLQLPDANKPFTLQPWQQFIVGSLFGWKGPDGFRRFRTGYIEVSKGSGKTPLAAALGLYGLIADGEKAAEIYSAATTEKQAHILFRDAKNIAEASPGLQELVEAGELKIDERNIAYFPTASFFRPVSSEHRALSGPRPHMGLIDELHEHPTPLVVDKIKKGAKGRTQPLFLEITNSGFDRETVCWEHHEYSRKILEQQDENDSWFGYVCQLDVCEEHRKEGRTQPVDECEGCDNWRDESVWPKVNPNLGISIQPKYLREQVQAATGMPAEEGITKRLCFCCWTESRTVWIPAESWTAAKENYHFRHLQGRMTWAGLDLANRYDVNALVMWFRDESERGPVFRMVPTFWIPEDVALERERKDRVPYRLWESQGWIYFTKGDVTDYNVIEDFIKLTATQYKFQDVNYDPDNCTQMAVSLRQHGVNMVQFNQNIQMFTEPTKEFGRLLKDGRLKHDGNPVMTWMASNVEIMTDRKGNCRPVKPAPGEGGGSGKKVDGVIAAVMALRSAILATEESSVYESRGITVVGATPATGSVNRMTVLESYEDDDDD